MWSDGFKRVMAVISVVVMIGLVLVGYLTWSEMRENERLDYVPELPEFWTGCGEILEPPFYHPDIESEHNVGMVYVEPCGHSGERILSNFIPKNNGTDQAWKEAINNPKMVGKKVRLYLRPLEFTISEDAEEIFGNCIVGVRQFAIPDNSPGMAKSEGQILVGLPNAAFVEKIHVIPHPKTKMALLLISKRSQTETDEIFFPQIGGESKMICPLIGGWFVDEGLVEINGVVGLDVTPLVYHEMNVGWTQRIALPPSKKSYELSQEGKL